MRVLKRNKPCIYPICRRAHPATYTMGPILVRPVCWPILSLATLPRYFARTAISQSKRRPLARTHAPSSPGSPPPKCDLLGNDDGRVLFPHANTDAHPASVLCPGLGLLRETGDILGNTERGVACHPIRRCRPAVGLSFSKDHMPRGSPVPNCRVGLVRFLQTRGAWAQLASARTNNGPWCLAKGAGHH